MPAFLFDLPVRLSALGKEFGTTVERRAAMTKPLRAALLERPIAEFVEAYENNPIAPESGLVSCTGGLGADEAARLVSQYGL